MTSHTLSASCVDSWKVFILWLFVMMPHSTFLYCAAVESVCLTSTRLVCTKGCILLVIVSESMSIDNLVKLVPLAWVGCLACSGSLLNSGISLLSWVPLFIFQDLSMSFKFYEEKWRDVHWVSGFNVDVGLIPIFSSCGKKSNQNWSYRVLLDNADFPLVIDHWLQNRGCWARTFALKSYSRKQFSVAIALNGSHSLLNFCHLIMQTAKFSKSFRRCYFM